MKRIALALIATLAACPSHAALIVTQTSNIAGGMAAFGPSTTAFNWNAGGAPGTAVGNINIMNWIDGVGFDNGVNPANDLAINGVENVTWNFAAPVTHIGFAIATGLGRFPTEFDHLGASFNLLTNTGDTATLTLVDPGNGYAAWVEITSLSAFSSLTFTEVGTNIQDQYWGNVLSAASAVPESGTWLMMLAGLGFVGGAMRVRPSARTVHS